MKDKRRHQRFNSLHLVSYKFFNENDELCGQGVGRTLNISQGGILLEIETPVDYEIKTVHMEIALDDTLILLSGCAIFIKKLDKGYIECGVKFQRISPGSLDLLLNYIKEFFGETNKKIGLLRSKASGIDNVVLTLSKEHRIITDYAITCRETLEGLGSEYMAQTLSTLFFYMENDLGKHFYFEEQVLFQAALSGTVSGDEISSLVKKFKDDHPLIMAELDEISSSLKVLVKNQENIDAKIKDRIEAFLEKLKAHARKEMVELFPLIDSNEEKMKILNRLFA